jgi:hypothetical protein
MTEIDIDNSDRLNGPSSRMVRDRRNIEHTGIVTSENLLQLAFIFIFGFCYDFGMTPLQALYPVEACPTKHEARVLV